MIRKVLFGLMAASLAGSAWAADAPSGWVKCTQNKGTTCAMSGTHQVTMGKNNVYAPYQNLSGSFVCTAATFPGVLTSVSGSTTAWMGK